MDRLSEVYFVFHGRHGKKEVVANVLPGKVVVWGLKINGIFIGSDTTQRVMISELQARRMAVSIDKKVKRLLTYHNEHNKKTTL